MLDAASAAPSRYGWPGQGWRCWPGPPAELDETARLVREAGGEAFTAVADVTDLEALRRAVTDAEAALGPIEVLVNNAGTGGRMHSLVEADPELWRQVLDVNVLGPVRLCSLVLPGMVARGRGYVVNVDAACRARGPCLAAARTAPRRLR